MNNPLLLIDVSSLAYRSLYSMGDLSYGGVATGAMYGMFRAVMNLQELFQTDRVAWCFDRGCGKRRELCSTYKAKRHQDEDEEKREVHRSMRQQLYRLRTDYLPGIGYRNVWCQDDYEADDVIASACDCLPRGDEAVMVSSDGDLYQLLRAGRISQWLPGKEVAMTHELFVREWGIEPTQWADVKAIAGCSSDNVIGVAGVGEKTAAKFLSGRLKPGLKAYEAIVNSNDVWRRNLPLVSLPFPGVERFEAVEDHVTEERCRKVLGGKLGMKSLFDGSRRR